jgi:hypothetical protein
MNILYLTEFGDLQSANRTDVGVFGSMLCDRIQSGLANFALVRADWKLLIAQTEVA